MPVDVLALRGMVLHNTLILTKKHILYGAHLLPGWARLSPAVSGGNADVLPSQVAGCYDVEAPSSNVNFEHAVPSVPVPAIASPIPLPVSILVQRVQVFHVVSSIISS